MHKLTIQSITKQHSIPDDADYLDVAFAILETIEDEKETITVYEGRHGFPLDTPEEDITEQLSKFLDTHLADQNRTIANEKVEAIHKQADETIANLEGLEINASSQESNQ